MDDPNNNEEFDASQAMQKARKQAQAQARSQAKDGNKKENSSKKVGAILHVNNYRNGVPEAKCKMSKNPNFPSTLKPGYIVRSKGAPTADSYVIEAKLAARVYMVRNQKSDKFCALKIEPYYNEGDVKQLKRDVFILMEASKQDQRFNNHFPKLITKGRVPDHFKYVITSLCDFNLDDLREKVIKSDFSLKTAARLSTQAFQAVHDMHTLGYLHRNIAPSKFMLGLENSTLIYLGGFSTAYHYKRKDGKESPSPKKLYKMSKTRFLPRAYHRFKDFSRFDDLESWLYTSIDLFGRKLLPWFDNMDEAQIIANKERFFFDAFEEIFTYAPKQLQVIQKYIDKNNDDDKPNYTFMGITLAGMRDKLQFPCNGPFDFQNRHGSNNKKSKNKRPTKEEKDAGEGGPAIAPVSTTSKKRKSSKRTRNGGGGGPSINAPSVEVFEEGEAEGPVGVEDTKHSVDVDRALSMARKKKSSKAGATARAADLDTADHGPLQPVDPGVVKAMKKKNNYLPLSPPPPPLEEEDEDDNGNEMQPLPPPPPIIKAKAPKLSKQKLKKKASAPTSKLETPPAEKPAVEKEVEGGEEEDGGGGDEDKEDGNETGTGTDNMKHDL